MANAYILGGARVHIGRQDKRIDQGAGGKFTKPGIEITLPSLTGPAVQIGVIVGYVLFSFVFVAGFSFASAPANSLTIHVVEFSNLSVPVLALGLAFLPKRQIWLAFAVFLMTFLVSELIMIGWTQTVGWTAYGMMKSLAVSMIIGVISGLVTRRQLQPKGEGSLEAFPEKAALWGAATLTLSGFGIGGLALWFSTSGQTDPEVVKTLLWMMALRLLRLGLVLGAGMLLLRSFPTRKQWPEVAVHVSLFGLLGVMCLEGYALVHEADAPLLALFVLFMRPAPVAISGILGGILVFVFFTGEYVDLPIDVGLSNWRLETVANILFISLLIVAVLKVRVARVESVQMQALGRMKRAQELARFGDFVYDVRQQLAFFDGTAQTIMRVPNLQGADGFLERVHPEDRDRIVESTTSTDESGRSFSFRFSMDGPWTETSKVRHFTGFALNETSASGRTVTYGLLADVTQEHAQEEHLRLVLAELSERQGQQTQLFSMISHELRTPASIISMLADELDDGKNWKTIGPQMRAVVEQLLSVLGDMRQTVRPEQNLPIKKETFCPEGLAQSVRDAFRSMAELRGITIVLDMGDGAKERRSTDRVRLNQTISNLVKNAILHSQATEIRIAYREEPGQTGIWTVSDNGRNIPESQKNRLFQPFARSQDQGARSDGSGLGLYIAKGAIELLGGTIEYVDRPMSGAEFRIELHMPPPDADIQAADEIPSMEALDFKALTALILEDSETMGSLLAQRLQRIFGEVKWLRDGASGLAWAGLNKPDVIISDLFMPGLSGDEIARRLRSRGFDRPIIGMTAAEIGEDVERFRKSGVDAVITKPIRIKDLERALARAV